MTELPGIGSDPGSYALLLAGDCRNTVTVGRRGTLGLQPGFYLYVGSALGPGGLRARLSHHLRETTRPHWHIDYLRRVMPIVEIWFVPGQRRLEHAWARIANGFPAATIPLPRLGASDCRCPAHVFFLPDRGVAQKLRERLGATGKPVMMLQNDWTYPHRLQCSTL